MVLQGLAVAKNFFCARGRAAPATMKDGDLVAALLKGRRRVWANEAVAADEKEFHIFNSIFRAEASSNEALRQS